MQRLLFTRKFWLLGALALASSSLWAQDDPPSRVARLNYLNGSVSFQPSGHDDWQAAQINYPLTTGDRLWADDNSRAELHIASTAIRLDAHTALAFLNLDDRMTQLRLSDGTVTISVRHLGEDDNYEIDTPNGAVTILRPGKYRIDADPDRQVVTVTVRSGEAEVTAGGSAFPVHGRQSVFITGDESPATDIRAAISYDDFDRWAEDRDDRFERRPPPRYVSSDMVGYEDLEDNGNWRDYPGYGPVWVPRVQAGWAPYRYGHWAWVEPWGWTWVDDAPWGFAPFHYGRWCYVGGAWGWVPGPRVVRPVYAPALVAFVGGNNWAVGLSAGGGPAVGWFPLGPREIYRPGYRVSETYVRQVNVTNITNVTNINNVNVTNVRYVNQSVPGAVTAVSRNDFAASRPVSRAAVAVPANAVARAQVVSTAPPVTRQQAMMARPVSNVPVARPPQASVSVPVVTKTAPPAATAAIARPTGAGVYRPAIPNRPVQPTDPPRTATPNRPGQPPSVYQPSPQPQRPNQPAYRPPAEQARPQNEPAYRPPAQQSRPQNEPAYRPAPAQPQRQPQARPEAAPHYHPDRPPEAQRRQQNEERRQERPERGRPEKERRDR